MSSFWKAVGSALALGAALLGAPAAHAQDLYMDMFNSANQAAVSLSLVTLNNAAVMASTRGAAASRRATGATSLAYAPTAALRQQTVRELGQKLQAKNPAAAQALTNALGPGKTDYDQLFSKMVQSSGLPADNAATAFAAYLELGYSVVNDVQDASAITPATDRALQRQAAGLLEANKNLASPAAVARFGEATKLQTVLLYLGWQSARQHGQAAQFRASIAQQFRQQGLDMSAVRLTQQGLVKK